MADLVKYALLMVVLIVMGAGDAQALKGKCLLVVNGVTYINGSCVISMEQNGSFGFDDGRMKTKCRSYDLGPKECSMANTIAISRGTFGSLETEDGRRGFMNWNGGNALHAHDRLQNLTRKGACWSNPTKTAQLCAWRTSSSQPRPRIRSNNFNGWCFPADACMGVQSPIVNNSYSTCESTCTLSNPVKVNDLDATLYYDICRGDWGSSSNRVMLLRIANSNGKSELMVIGKHGVKNLERCR